MFNLFSNAPSSSASLLGAPTITWGSGPSSNLPNPLELGAKRIGQPVTGRSSGTGGGLSVGSGSVKLNLGGSPGPGTANQALLSPAVQARTPAGLRAAAKGSPLPVINGERRVGVTEALGGGDTVDTERYHPLSGSEFLDVDFLRNAYAQRQAASASGNPTAFRWGGVPDEVRSLVTGLPSRDDRTRARAADLQDWQANIATQEGRLTERQKIEAQRLSDIDKAVMQFTHVFDPQRKISRDEAREMGRLTAVDPYAVWDRWLQTADGQEYLAADAQGLAGQWHKKRPRTPAELMAQGIQPGSPNFDRLDAQLRDLDLLDARDAWQAGGMDPNALPDILAQATGYGDAALDPVTGLPLPDSDPRSGRVSGWGLSRLFPVIGDSHEVLQDLAAPLLEMDNALQTAQSGRFIDPVTGESRVGQGILINSQADLDAIMAAPGYTGRRDLEWSGLKGGFDPYTTASSIAGDYGLISPGTLDGQNYTSWDPITNPAGYLQWLNAFGYSPPGEADQYATMGAYGIPDLIRIDQRTGEVMIDPTNLLSIAGQYATTDPNTAVRYGSADNAPSLNAGTIASVVELLNQAGITGPQSLGFLNAARVLSPEAWQNYQAGQATQDADTKRFLDFQSGKLPLDEMVEFFNWQAGVRGDPAMNAARYDTALPTYDPAAPRTATAPTHSTAASRLIDGVNQGLEGDALRDFVLGENAGALPWEGENREWIKGFYGSAYGEDAAGLFPGFDMRGNQTTIAHPVLGNVSEGTAHNFERWLVNNWDKVPASDRVARSYAEEFARRYYQSLRGERPKDRLLMADWRPSDAGKGGGPSRYSDYGKDRAVSDGGAAVLRGDETTGTATRTVPDFRKGGMMVESDRPVSVEPFGPAGQATMSDEEFQQLLSEHLATILPRDEPVPLYGSDQAPFQYANSPLAGVPEWMLPIVLQNPDLRHLFGVPA